MTDTTAAAKGAFSMAAILPDFEPLSRLWESESPPFRSEQAARWFIRQNKVRLTEMGAVALWQGRLYIHAGKFLEIVRERALAAYRERYAAGVTE